MGTQPNTPNQDTPPTPAPPAPDPKAERIKLIEAIQKERGTHVISYITSTRQSLEVQMAMDSIRKIYEHLQLIKEAKKDVKID
jgi:hypothetical protein